MARIRTVKPEIVQSVRLAECSRDARLLFVYLITQADCYGNQRGDARLLRGQLFPYDDDITADLVDQWLEELVGRGLVAVYEVAGQRYLNLPSWAEHQVVSKPGRPLVPGPDEGTPCIPANPQGNPGPPAGTLADLDLDLDLDLDRSPDADEGEPRAADDRTDARPRAERVSEAEFREFWNAYPRKTGGPKAAEAKYRAARKAGTSHETIMAGVAGYVADIRRRGTEERFIAHATTWLNQGRWGDDYAGTPIRRLEAVPMTQEEAQAKLARMIGGIDA